MALQSLVGEVPVHELIGKPFDLDETIGDARPAQASDLDYPARDATA